MWQCRRIPSPGKNAGRSGRRGHRSCRGAASEIRGNGGRKRPRKLSAGRTFRHILLRPLGMFGWHRPLHRLAQAAASGRCIGSLLPVRGHFGTEPRQRSESVADYGWIVDAWGRDFRRLSAFERFIADARREIGRKKPAFRHQAVPAFLLTLSHDRSPQTQKYDRFPAVRDLRDVRPRDLPSFPGPVLSA